jgi:hypothetical protein
VAGGFFLVTSLSLTLISGGGSANAGRSVLDLLPQSSAPATTPEPETLPAQPEDQRQDPTESRAPSNSQFVTLGPPEASAATVAPAPSDAATRAGPITERPTQTAATTPQRATTQQTTQRPNPPPAPTTRSVPATTQPTPTPTTTNGAVAGIDLTTDTTLETESSETSTGLEAVRRERAGPDQ